MASSTPWKALAKRLRPYKETALTTAMAYWNLMQERNQLKTALTDSQAREAELIESIRHLVDVLERDGGYTEENHAEMMRENGEAGEPWTALASVRAVIAGKAMYDVEAETRRAYEAREAVLVGALRKTTAVVEAARHVERGLSRSKTRTSGRVDIDVNGVDPLDGYDLLELLRNALADLDTPTGREEL